MSRDEVSLTSKHQSESESVSSVLAQQGFILQGQNIPIGLNCDSFATDSVGSNCATQPVCCDKTLVVSGTFLFVDYVCAPCVDSPLSRAVSGSTVTLSTLYSERWSGHSEEIGRYGHSFFHTSTIF